MAHLRVVDERVASVYDLHLDEGGTQWCDKPVPVHPGREAGPGGHDGCVGCHVIDCKLRDGGVRCCGDLFRRDSLIDESLVIESVAVYDGCAAKNARDFCHANSMSRQIVLRKLFERHERVNFLL